MAKQAVKVGKGVPGFGSSKGSSNRIWIGKGFTLELGEVTATSVMKGKEETGKNVRIPFTILGGPRQDDDTDPKGRKGNIFINVDYSLDFTVDNLADVFIATGVKFAGSDEPPYHKLEGKKVNVDFFARHSDKDGKDYQGHRFVKPKVGRAARDEDDED